MGRPAARYYDLAINPGHVDHTPFISPHPVQGPILGGDPTTIVNGRFAARMQDPGVHAGCSGPNVFHIAQGSPVVQIGGRPAARQGDATMHCGGQPGSIVGGSPSVLIGDAPYGGGGSPVSPTPRVAEAQRKRDLLDLKEGKVEAVEPDKLGTGVVRERRDTTDAGFAEAVSAPPTKPLAAPPSAPKTPEAVAEEQKRAEEGPKPEPEQVHVLAGILVDAGKSPIRREVVAVLPEGALTEIARTETDDRGRFLVTGLEAGRYRLAVIEMAEVWAETAPGTATAGRAPATRLPVGGDILIVRLLDSGLSPLPNTLYVLVAGGQRREGRSDAQGVLSEPSVPAGSLELQVDGKKYEVVSQNRGGRLLTPFDLVIGSGDGRDERGFLTAGDGEVEGDGEDTPLGEPL